MTVCSKGEGLQLRFGSVYVRRLNGRLRFKMFKVCIYFFTVCIRIIILCSSVALSVDE